MRELTSFEVDYVSGGEGQSMRSLMVDLVRWFRGYDDIRSPYDPLTGKPIGLVQAEEDVC